MIRFRFSVGLAFGLGIGSPRHEKPTPPCALLGIYRLGYLCHKIRKQGKATVFGSE